MLIEYRSAFQISKFLELWVIIYDLKFWGWNVSLGNLWIEFLRIFHILMSPSGSILTNAFLRTLFWYSTDFFKFTYVWLACLPLNSFFRCNNWILGNLNSGRVCWSKVTIGVVLAKNGYRKCLNLRFQSSGNYVSPTVSFLPKTRGFSKVTPSFSIVALILSGCLLMMGQWKFIFIKGLYGIYVHRFHNWTLNLVSKVYQEQILLLLQSDS